jgi:hypothetical protein
VRERARVGRRRRTCFVLLLVKTLFVLFLFNGRRLTVNALRAIDTTGNKNGLLLPNSVTDQGESKIMKCRRILFVSRPLPVERRRLFSPHALNRLPNPDCTEALHIRNSLPDDVIVQRVDERLSGTSCSGYTQPSNLLLCFFLHALSPTAASVPSSISLFVILYDCFRSLGELYFVQRLRGTDTP